MIFPKSRETTEKLKQRNLGERKPCLWKNKEREKEVSIARQKAEGVFQRMNE